MTQIGGRGEGEGRVRSRRSRPRRRRSWRLDTEEDKNVDVAQERARGARGGKKEADFTSPLSDDIEQDGLFHLEMSKGKDGAKKFYKSFTTAFPDAKFDDDEAFASATTRSSSRR